MKTKTNFKLTLAFFFICNILKNENKNKYKTSVELGAKFNINPKVEAEARFGNIKVSDEFDLPRVQKFVSTSLIIPVNEAFYFSLNYNGMFDKDGNTHTGYAQFNYLW
nr:hypothetical protein [Campylobacter jejuni]